MSSVKFTSLDIFFLFMLRSHCCNDRFHMLHDFYYCGQLLDDKRSKDREQKFCLSLKFIKMCFFISAESQIITSWPNCYSYHSSHRVSFIHFIIESHLCHFRNNHNYYGNISLLMPLFFVCSLSR